MLCGIRSSRHLFRYGSSGAARSSWAIYDNEEIGPGLLASKAANSCLALTISSGSCHRKDFGKRLGNLLAVINAIGGNPQR
jgi:hypothetical protein